MMKNIYLIGMMGSGKTSTARELAALLKLPLVDLDADLARKSEHTIAEIFKNSGEEIFRDMEANLLTEQAKRNNCVVATGGGVVLRRQNRELMRATGLVIFLETSLDVLWDRVSKEKGRPLLEDFDPKLKLMSLLRMRQPFYDDCAEMRVITDGKTAKQVAEEIQGKLNAND